MMWSATIPFRVAILTALVGVGRIRADGQWSGQLERALSSTDAETRRRAIEDLRQDAGAAAHVLQAMNTAVGLRSAQLAVLAGGILEPDVLTKVLTSERNPASPGSLPREILAWAFLDRLAGETDTVPKSHEPGRPKRGIDPGSALGVRALAVAAALCRDPNWRSRSAAARVLAAVEGDAPSELHRALLRDAAWPVRAEALRSLGRLPIGEHVQILEEVLRDPPSPYEQRVALGVMMELDYEPGLRAALAAEEEAIQLEAVERLAGLKTLDLLTREALIRTRRRTRSEKVQYEIRGLLERVPPDAGRETQ